ncbi:hypothetical protein BJ170DRAFT_129790 [Xylariales sp. AK1849]|nr:hypothetical protein BJ170DRAFT_129790 [Xylariales sp. AK1849]
MTRLAKTCQCSTSGSGTGTSEHVSSLRFKGLSYISPITAHLFVVPAIFEVDRQIDIYLYDDGCSSYNHIVSCYPVYAGELHILMASGIISKNMHSYSDLMSGLDVKHHMNSIVFCPTSSDGRSLTLFTVIFGSGRSVVCLVLLLLTFFYYHFRSLSRQEKFTLIGASISRLIDTSRPYTRSWFSLEPFGSVQSVR